MANLEGFKHKFIVLKHDEYDRVTTPTERNHVVAIGEKIGKLRIEEGKTPYPKYLVINTEESYADEVIEILKRHDQWG